MGGAWRNIAVRLSADVSSYVGKLGMAAGATRQLGKEIGATASQAEGKVRQVTDRAGKLALAVGAAVALTLAAATGATMGFDKAMSNVSAVTRDATQSVDQHAASQDRLREAALQAGKLTVFSAKESATAVGELARAGVGVRDVLGGGLRGALDLAAAGQLQLKTAATITAQALNIFQLRGSQATRVADTLAAGANKSAADVEQLGQALRMGGLVARQLDLTLEQTTGTLALFADNALVGSDAGTSLKTMLQRLSPQSKEAGDLMEHLGLKFFDAQGRFIGIERLAGVLQERLSGLTQEQRLSALTTIFGADAIRGANILYEEGAAGVREYVKAVTDQGAAARMAGEQLDNLAGDVEQFKGSLETAFITGGSSATGFLRTVVQGVTGAVNGFLELPPAAQTAAGGLTVLVGAAATAGGAFLLLAPRVKPALDVLHQIAPAGTRLGGALRVAGVGLGVLTGALIGGSFVLSEYGKEKAKAAKLTDDFAAALRREQEGLKGETNKLLSQALTDTGAAAAAERLGVGLDVVTAAVKGNERAWRSLRTTERAALDQFASGDPATRRRALEISELVQKVEDLRHGYESGQVKAEDLAEAEKELGAGQAAQSADAERAKLSNESLTKAMEDQKAAAEADQKAIDDLAGALSTIASPSSALATVAEEAADAASGALRTRLDVERDALRDRHETERDAARRRTEMIGASEKEAIAAVDRALDQRRHVVTAGLSEEAQAARQADIARLEQEKDALQERQAAVAASGEAIAAEAERALAKRQEAEDRALAKRHEAAQKGELARPSLGAFAAQLEQETKDAEGFQRNLLTVAKRFGPDVARELSKLGKEGIPIVAAFADATDAEGRRAADAMRRNMEVASAESAKVLETGFDLMEALVGDRGRRIADRFLEEMRKGEVPLAEIIARYMAIISPLSAPGTPVIDVATGRIVAVRTGEPGQFRTVEGGRPTNVRFEAEGGYYPTAAAGSYVVRFAAGGERHEAEYAGPGPARIWREPETGGESYIPHSPAKRSRATGVLSQTASAFGYRLEPATATATRFAEGGMVGPVAAPAAATVSVAGGPGYDALLAEVRALRETLANLPLAPTVLDYDQHNTFTGNEGWPATSELRAIGYEAAHTLGRVVTR